MIPDSDFDFGHSPWYFPVHVHWESRKFPPTYANVKQCLESAWIALGDWASWVRLTAGRPLPMPWGHMAHVFVGVDLSWKPNSPAGAAGGDFRYPPPDSNWIRGAWVDDRYFLTPAAMGLTVAHEIDHLLGWNMKHPPFSPELRAAGAKAAVNATRGWGVPLPDRSPSNT